MLAHDEEEEEVSLGEFSTDEEDLVFCEVVAGVLACEAIHLSATPALVSCDGGVWGTSTLPSIPYPDVIPPPLPAPIQRHTPKLKINHHERDVHSSTDHSIDSTLKSTERQRPWSKVPRNLKFVWKRPHTRNEQGTPSPYLDPTQSSPINNTSSKCHFMVRKRPTQISNKSKNKWQAPSTQSSNKFEIRYETPPTRETGHI